MKSFTQLVVLLLLSAAALVLAAPSPHLNVDLSSRDVDGPDDYGRCMGEVCI
ncbi:hypothetical protein CC1G_15660 [Coprinopsis cinerea okayama7|uniref:Uncharacterized protein n=1 Tax=Coprinopsis cinerea (strain Okayama-7 / 130 / ATCC MYA-4618 / FGSC 9003) TaxID=240176 RepID=D6RQC0_COPC7|nr:hypothetical protein CC1G_15660 [Coprinopsis cinerea okayama7\|eukprot:XP_002910230.1 hypothetical protein CC1G_15660 [Coprinopsis cinerea okayama7\